MTGTLPARQCSVCGTIFEGHRCPECNPRTRRRLSRAAPEKKRRFDKFYQSNRWKRKSYGYRRRHPFCAWCLRDGYLVKADVVDHVVPLAAGGAPMDDANLQSLCHQCHAIKTAMDKQQGKGV